MTLSRDEVLLADRHGEDSKAYKAQQAKVHRLENEEWDRIKKAHEDKVRGERGRLHRLSSAMNQSAAALRALELQVHEDVRSERSEAEAELRAVVARLPELEGALRTYRSTLERLVKGQAPKVSIEGQKKAIADLEKDVVALKAQVKKAEGRVDAARKAFANAIEAIRKDALAQQ